MKESISESGYGQLYYLPEDEGDIIRDRERDIKLFIPEVFEEVES